MGDVATGGGDCSAGATALHGDGDMARSKSVADGGSSHEADWVQRVGNNTSGGEMVTAGGISWAGTDLEHAILTGGGDHAEPEDGLGRAAGNSQVDRAANPESKLRDDEAPADDSHGGRLKAPSGFGVNVSGEHGKEGRGFESSSSSSENDVSASTSIIREVCGGGARSSERKVFDSCDSASSECDGGEEPAELIDGDSSGEIANNAQATGGTSDKARGLDTGRSGEKRVLSTRSLSPQQTGTGVASTGGSDECTEPTQAGSTSLPSSFMVARNGGQEAARCRTSRIDAAIPGSRPDGVADESSNGEPSMCKRKDGTWPSPSFMAARENAEDMMSSSDDGEGGTRAMADFLPLHETSRAVRRPRARRRPPQGNNDQKIIDYFLRDSSQSSSDSRSPGG